jgi:glycolate oxidase subunit GlcD
MGAADPWALWEDLAAGHVAAGALALSLTLPRRALPAFAERASAAARRYGLPLRLWGDGGVGVLHVSVAAPAAGRRAAAEQLLAVLKALAVAEGGAVATELGAREYDEVQRPKDEGRRARDEGRLVAGAGRGIAHDQGARLGQSLMISALSAETGPSSALPGPASTPSALLAALRAVVGEGYLLVRGEDLATYETDASIARPDGAALAVALPASTAEVAELVRLAAASSVPVVTRGAGSGLAGGATPTRGALVISLNRLEAIQIDREQMVAHVGGGAITAEVQKAAEGAGLFYPPDPSSQTASTIGGNIACNAGGPRCVKYGVTADYVLAVTVVLADGSVARWGDGLSGQDPRSGLVQLLVGSEGTLGIITEATLRLIPLPAARRTTMALFASLEAACSTVEQIMAAGIVPAGLELMDDSCLVAVEGYLKLGLPQDAGAMLLMLADGEPEEVDADTERLAELARAGGASSVQVARSAADEANLWKARRGVSIALARVRPNRLGEDISVPLPQIAACVRQIKAASVKHGLPIVVFGHAGDGNLHPNILFDAKDPAETARIWPAAEDVFGAALAVGGTLSGEHGIGTLKKPFMRQALGEAAIAVQRRIKQQFDPAGLLNPGKVLPE